MEKKTVAILGLGLFGSSVAKQLASHDVEVIGIDKDMECVEAVVNYVEVALQADFTKLDQLEEADIANVDIAIVATGERLESAILGILNLKKLGVPEVIVKAKDVNHLEVLKKVGADRVLLPEIETGRRLGNEIAKANVIDSLRIDDRYNIVEIHAIRKWIGKSIMELNLRQDFGFNILAMRTNKSKEIQIMVNPDYIIQEGDLFIALIEETSLEALDQLQDR